jgi:hypothetical protein
MATRGSSPVAGSARAHVEDLSRLACGAEFFDRTTHLDFKLVEHGRTDLADELAVLEDALEEAARETGSPATEEGGVGRLLASRPDLAAGLEVFLDRALAVLGPLNPDDLASAVPVAAGLHVTPAQAAGLEVVRRGRIEPQNN